jgi:hypothetical protein
MLVANPAPFLSDKGAAPGSANHLGCGTRATHLIAKGSVDVNEHTRCPHLSR